MYYILGASAQFVQRLSQSVHCVHTGWLMAVHIIIRSYYANNKRLSPRFFSSLEFNQKHWDCCWATMTFCCDINIQNEGQYTHTHIHTKHMGRQAHPSTHTELSKQTEFLLTYQWELFEPDVRYLHIALWKCEPASVPVPVCMCGIAKWLNAYQMLVHCV